MHFCNQPVRKGIIYPSNAQLTVHQAGLCNLTCPSMNMTSLAAPRPAPGISCLQQDAPRNQADIVAASRWLRRSLRGNMASTNFRDGNSPGQTRTATAPACEACRKLKMKCTRAEPQGGGGILREPCERCKKTNRACKIPDPRPLGRRRGALGRYRGFEKAYRKLQSEEKRAKFSRGIDDIYEAGHLPAGEEPTLESSLSYESADHSRFSSTTGDPFLGPPVRTPGETVTQVDHEEEDQSQLNQEPISNPLALLAYASDAAQTSEASPVSTDILPTLDSQEFTREPQACRGTGESEGYRLLHRPGYVSLGLQLSRASLVQGLDTLLAPVDCEYQSLDYFKERTWAHRRDVGPDLDPVDLKLVTMEEANYLFPIYFARLHPVNGILDPMLHTPDFVRSESSLLFTWILAITSQFDHASAPIAERLRLHGEKLSRYVHTCGYKSVEIVQGYYISLLSNTPARTLTEERSWLYTMYAFGVATELGLDQESGSHRYTRVAHSFRSSRTQQCQNMPSFDSGPAEASPRSIHGPLTDHTAYEERLARNRERTWLRILLWERANSAACGRIHSFPETSLTRAIDTWWLHPLADMTDKYTSAFIILRKSLASLQVELKHQVQFTHSDPHWVRELVDTALQNWCNTWLPQPRNNTSTLLPEQLSIIFLHHVYVHGRLWTLSLALSGSVARAQDLDTIRQDCFESAVNCCETAVRDLQAVGESLYCMLAPTWAMISYAAVLTLKIFPALYGPRIGIEVELLALLSQVALQLQRAGTTPSHRFGIAALLGQHLMMILRARAVSLREPSRARERQLDPSHDHKHDIGQRLPEWPVATPQITPRNPLVSDWDPFLTPAISDQDGFAGEGFADIFREIFGPGFGNFF